jgi:hypothetical protein
MDEMVPPVGNVNPEAVSLSVPAPDIVPDSVSDEPECVITAPEGIESVPAVEVSVPPTVKLPLAVTVPEELMVRLLNVFVPCPSSVPVFVIVTVEVPAVNVPLLSHEPDEVIAVAPSAVNDPIISTLPAVIVSPPAALG